MSKISPGGTLSLYTLYLFFFSLSLQDLKFEKKPYILWEKYREYLSKYTLQLSSQVH